jgi:Rrf2 family transcriptional regulator, cysteine metabolism repressor
LGGSPDSLPVKLSVKSDYACRAVLWLSRHYSGGGARRVEEMATEHGISPNYLVQILIEMKSGQIVKSVRGKEGGYLLARPPGKISMGDVLRCMHGEIFESPAIKDAQCPSELREAWKKLQASVTDAADGITFQQLLEDGAEKNRMFYI